MWDWVCDDMRSTPWELTFCIESRLPRCHVPISHRKSSENSAADAAFAKGRSWIFPSSHIMDISASLQLRLVESIQAATACWAHCQIFLWNELEGGSLQRLQTGRKRPKHFGIEPEKTCCCSPLTGISNRFSSWRSSYSGWSMFDSGFGAVELPTSFYQPVCNRFVVFGCVGVLVWSVLCLYRSRASWFFIQVVQSGIISNALRIKKRLSIAAALGFIC